MNELTHHTKLTANIGLLPHSLLLACCLSVSPAVFAAAGLDANTITEDFGPFSSQQENQLKQKLTELGDVTDTVQDLPTAIGNFYGRTGLNSSDDPVQQLLDINMVASAEREANRILSDSGGAATGEMLSYINTIAPWINKPAPTVIAQVITPEAPAIVAAPPIGEMLTEQSALTVAISKLDSTINQLTDTVKFLY